MHRSFYFFSIFVLGLSVGSGLLQSALSYHLGNRIYSLPSFTEWLIVLTSISLSGSLFVLRYFYQKRYWLTFSTGAVTTAAFVCHYFVIYKVVTAQELTNFSTPTFFVFLGATLVYSISLMFSISGERPWLKSAGVCLFILCSILGTAFIWGTYSPNSRISSLFPKILWRVSLVNHLVPIFFIMNFLREEKTLGAGQPTKTVRYFDSFSIFVGITALVVTLVFAQKIASESHSLNGRHRSFNLDKESAQLFEARNYVDSNGDTLLYRLVKPLNYDPRKKYPLVVCLHHGGTHGRDNVRQLDSDPVPMLSDEANRKRYQAFLFIPQCPEGSGWGGIPNYPTVDEPVFETINTLEKEFSIEAKRCYVVGISGGGYGSWHFICARPKMFAAAVPICGAGDPKLASNIIDVPVWAFHGEKDRNVPVKGSRDMIEAIKEAGGSPRYTEFPDAGHNIWGQVESTPGLMDWLFAQKRD